MNGKDLLKVLEDKNIPTWMSNRLYTAKSIIDEVMNYFQDEICSSTGGDIVLDEEEQFFVTINRKTHRVVTINTDCMKFDDGEVCGLDDMTVGETLDFLTKVGFMFDDIENKNYVEE